MASPEIIFQIAGGSAEEGPEGYEPARTLARQPGFAMWSMPLTPHMSPAAIGCSVVKLRGCPSASNLAPTAASMASGQPSAEDEEIVTMAPSGIRRAASVAVKILVLVISVSYHEIDGSFASRTRSLTRRQRDAQRLDSVLARCGRRATAGHRIVEQANRP